MEVSERFNLCKLKNLCLNCLNPAHKLINCTSKSKSSFCYRKHHSLSHRNNTQPITEKRNQSSFVNHSPCVDVTPPTTHFAIGESLTPSSGGTTQNVVPQSKQTHVLLCTAFAYVRNGCGEYKKCKTILDSASQAFFITNNCAAFLELKRNKINIPVGGFNGATGTVGQQVNTVLSSKNKEFVTDIEFLVVPKITDLAQSQQIDIDYILTGSVQTNCNKISCHLSIEDTHLDETLRSFWEIEALPEKTPIDDELKYCMEHLDTTHTRDINGRYIVQMTIVKDTVQLGLSKDLTVKGLNSTLIRLNKNPDIKKLYSDFLDEYANLGHMEEVKENILPNPYYYIPHQAVLGPDKSTTKLRVVFNASAKTSKGISLNDALLKGGIVQNELWCTLLRFRKHIIAFSADVKKMYRQVKIHPSQQDLLRIVWKTSADSPLKTYRLTTVTYGTTCAPFLATRTLLQLSEDEKQNFPLASPIVKR
ncbi:integrase catalytic domain-containing protein [Trichonephila clavipes]|nr:integrase catalytic domain-containing protein [Trichonephila clavipes]